MASGCYPYTLDIFTPSKSSVNTSFVNSLMSLANSNLSRVIGMNVRLNVRHGMSNIVHARSIALTKWYDHSKDGDLFLFVDSDHVFSQKDIVDAVNLKNSDISCGVYCKSSGEPNAWPVNLEAFLDNYQDNRLLYAGTGFMLISRPICSKIVNFINKLDGGSRFCINSPSDEYIIPFFRTRFVDSENGLEPVDVKHWLGEDYSFCWLARQCGGDIRGFISQTLGHEVYTIKNFFPTNFKGYNWPRGSIVYICGNNISRFDPTHKFQGGSEKAVIQLCKNWIKNPTVTSVTVFGNVNEGNYDGVEYKSLDKLNITDTFDTVILWRSQVTEMINIIKGNKIIVDYHDEVAHGNKLDNVALRADKVFVKSMYHYSQIENKVPQHKICVLKNGIEDEVFNALENTKNIKRDKNKFIYASSYTRGLENILKYCWPHIRKGIPTAELHCFYGMKYDSKIDVDKMKKLLNETDGVYDHDRVDINKIIEEKQNSSFHIYLTDHSSEIDCITIRESALLGCIPLLTRESVFNERIGVFYDMDREKNEVESYKDIAHEIVNMINNEKLLEETRKKIQITALESEITWKDVSEAWIKNITT